MKRYITILATLGLMLTAGAQENYQQSFEIAKNLEIFANVYKTLHMQYVDDVDPGKTMKVAIDAMLASLDPYTNYYPESDIEDVKLQMLGEYGGIGALIHQKGNEIYISQPYEGMPADLAGIKPGDKIVEVNGVSTEGKNSGDVSSAMRGQAGTTVTLKLERDGKTIEKTLTRKEIKLKPVPYYGMVKGNVGYIKLNEFTPHAAADVRAAFKELKKDNPNMAGVVLDLRGNGGGLLNEAVDIVNIFEPKGKMVVEQKGKVATRNDKHMTRMAPEDTEIPVAVLIDEMSASASEIVSGSLQDFDRAVVIGSRSFGKGLVQNILPLNYNTQMKVTVSKYYIPSGRCIQALDYSHRDENGKVSKVPDSLRTAFKTSNGRTVYDGLGIEPDIEVKPEYISDISMALVSKFYLFDWATQFERSHEKIAPAQEFEITDAMYDDFVKYLEGKDLSYKTATEEVLKELREVAKEEHFIDNIQSTIDQMEAQLKREKENDLVTYKKEIKLMMKSMLLSRYYYEKGQIAGTLGDDPCLLKAVEILNDKAQYKQILQSK